MIDTLFSLVLSPLQGDIVPWWIPRGLWPQCHQEKGQNQAEDLNLEGPAKSDEDVLYSQQNSHGACEFFTPCVGQSSILHMGDWNVISHYFLPSYQSAPHCNLVAQ
jgi:hypothetical protein